MACVDIVVPDLRQPDPIRLTAWHIRRGQHVVEGDRLVELCAGPVSIDLHAPASGVLTVTQVEEDTAVTSGQVLGSIVSTE